MKRLKKVEPKKLTLDHTTIRILADERLEFVAGGKTGRDTVTCSYAPDTCM